MLGKNDRKNDESIIVGKQILHPENLRTQINVDGDVWEIKYPTPLERQAIMRDVIMRLGGQSLSSVPEIYYTDLLMYVTLDHVIQESPDWWTSASDCLNDEITRRIWKEYQTFVDKFRKKINKGGFKGSG